MVVRRHRIFTTLDFEGKTWRLTVTRSFVMSALVRRVISDTEFFEFVEREHGTIALLAKRKIVKMALHGSEVLIDRYDLPE